MGNVPGVGVLRLTPSTGNPPHYCALPPHVVPVAWRDVSQSWCASKWMGELLHHSTFDQSNKCSTIRRE